MRPISICIHCGKEHYGWFSLCMECLYIQEYGQPTKPEPKRRNKDGLESNDNTR